MGPFDMSYQSYDKKQRSESMKEFDKAKISDNDHMAEFLPEYTNIARTPDWGAYMGTTTDVVVDTVELKTRDVISAFMGLQRQALKEAGKIKQTERRIEAIARIKRMAFFK